MGIEWREGYSWELGGGGGGGGEGTHGNWVGGGGKQSLLLSTEMQNSLSHNLIPGLKVYTNST